MDFIIKHEDMVDILESLNSESSAYLEKNSGEIIRTTEEYLDAVEEERSLIDEPDWYKAAAEEARQILTTDNYLPLPSSFDIDEYRIMEGFCLSRTDRDLGDILYGSIKGSKPFRRFKDTIYRSGIEEDWFRFKHEALKDIAIAWCEGHDIPYE